MNNTKTVDPNEGWPYKPGEGKVFWDMVMFFLDPWTNDETPEGDFISWYCTHEEFRESAIEELHNALLNPKLTVEQKTQISKALLTII